MRAALVLTLCACVSCSLAAPPGLQALLTPASLAEPPDAAIKLVGTTDPQGQGKDYRPLAPGEIATVLTISGPAVIHRVWSTSELTAKTRLVLRLDGTDQRVWEQGKLPEGQVAGDPLRAMDGQAYCSYLPLKVGHQAEFVATDLRPAGERAADGTPAAGNKFYQQVAYSPGAGGLLTPEQVDEVRKRLTEIAANPLAGVSDIVVEGSSQQLKAETLTLTAGKPVTVSGDERSFIQALVVDAAGVDFARLRATRLIVKSDGAAKACIDVPLPCLVGSYWAPDEFAAPFLAVKARKFVFRLPLPVGRGLELDLAPLGKGPGVTTLPLTLVRGTAAAAIPYRLCAEYRSTVSLRGEPIHLAQVSGEGVFVGCTFAADGLAHRKFSFLEGNEQIYVDGAPRPTWEGTGTEDFFNGAWYFSAGVNARPFHGLTHLVAGPPPRMSAYRLLLPDRIAFKQSLKVDMQHGSRNSVPDTLYQSVCFWYQKPPCTVAAAVEAPAPTSARGGGPAGGATPTGADEARVDIVTPTILAIIVLLAAVATARYLLRRQR